MKNYKDFEKTYLGFSDYASLIAVSCPTNWDDTNGDLRIGQIHFGGDNDYEAYECFGDVEIGSHYEKVFSGKNWLKIYNDQGLAYAGSRDDENGYTLVDIYRACDYGCIIHWHA